MLHETVAHIERHWTSRLTVGLLATSGTIGSGVYHEAAAGRALDLIVPDARHQQYVMEAIYGERGVKAGYVDGPCKEALLRALAHLAQRATTVVVLGCTELPLILEQHPAYRIDRADSRTTRSDGPPGSLLRRYGVRPSDPRFLSNQTCKQTGILSGWLVDKSFDIHRTSCEQR